MNNVDIKIFRERENLFRAASDHILERALDAVEKSGRFTFCLAGGSTPEPLYLMLAEEGGAYRDRFPWQHTHFFWGDERYVPSDHPASNFRMASETMLSKVPVPDENIHRVDTSAPSPEEAAKRYGSMLHDYFSTPSGELPCFDQVLLGLGEDGHTASLLPGADAVIERVRPVVSARGGSPDLPRITLTPPVLNQAASVLFIVTGSRKARIVKAVLEEAVDPLRFPAQAVRPPGGRLRWMLDAGAAQYIDRSRARTRT